MGCKGAVNVVSCLNDSTGKLIWKYSFPSVHDPQSTPTIDGTFVYTLSKEGILLCLNTKNGMLRWKKDLVSDFGAVKPVYGFAGSPVVEGNLLILNANTAGMALNKETGKLVWSSDKPPKKASFGTTNGTDYSTPVIYSLNGKRNALLMSWQGVSSVDVQTGKPFWLYEWACYSGNMIPDPLIMGNRIYIANECKEPLKKRSTLLDISGEMPKVLWISSDLTSDITSPVILDAYIYSCHEGPFSDSYSSSLRCIKLETGGLKWEAYPGGVRGKDAISLMAADGKLIILTERGILSIAEATPIGYREISKCDIRQAVRKARLGYTPPVLCNGRIYCRNWAGELN